MRIQTSEPTLVTDPTTQDQTDLASLFVKALYDIRDNEPQAVDQYSTPEIFTGFESIYVSGSNPNYIAVDMPIDIDDKDGNPVTQLTVTVNADGFTVENVDRKKFWQVMSRLDSLTPALIMHRFIELWQEGRNNLAHQTTNL